MQAYTLQQNDVTDVCAITMQVLQLYINDTISFNDDLIDDVAYITNALQQFTASKNIEQLQYAIMRQDTFVRDYYSTVLNVIDDIISEQCAV
jgi:hypothetical protein